MDLVNRAALSTKEPFTKDLIDLAPHVPPDLVIELRPWHVYDPPEIGRRYRQLIDSSACRSVSLRSAAGGCAGVVPVHGRRAAGQG